MLCRLRSLIVCLASRPERAAWTAGAFSAFSLAGAYLSQFGFGLVPCMLCLYQRKPHFACAGLGLVAFAVAKLVKRPAWNRYVLLGSSLALATGTVIALYHVGVEQGIFHLDACAQADVDLDASFEEMKQMVLETPSIHCDKPQFILFAVTMAGWNAIFSFLMWLFTLYALNRAFSKPGDAMKGCGGKGSSGGGCGKGGCGRK